MKKFLSSIQWQTWALFFLMVPGIFLRTYHFHDWLLFGDDQVRDAFVTNAALTGESAWPLMGPFMSYSGDGAHSEENSFHMGPIYYYFQIISASIFGNHPDTFAYPDVFFSILSIPLLYFFLCAYFDRSFSLGITGIYTVSAYFTAYSRFAWNTNLIPCFVLLFLLSLYKFLEKNEKTPWAWIVSLGFALGVGFQLHAIVMILFSAITFLVFMVSMKRNRGAWKRWAVVLLVFLVLNTGQIANEVKTNFTNTKTLFEIVLPTGNSTASVSSRKISLTKFKNDLSCHVEANALLVSSSGSEQCAHQFTTLPPEGLMQHFFKNFSNNPAFTILFTSLLFSILGYVFLISASFNKKETDRTKKDFARLVLAYSVIGFIVMLPLCDNKITDLRYFVFGFFMPFVFLGFLLQFIFQRVTRFRSLLIFPTLVLLYPLIASNAAALSDDAEPFLKNNVTCSSLYKTTLGELDPVVQYIVSHSNGHSQIYLGQNDSQRIILDSLTYLLKQEGINPIKFEGKSYSVSGDDLVFYVSCKIPRVLPQNTILKARATPPSFQKVDPIYVFQLN